MRIIAGGVRGTRVVADAAFMRFGGDTTAFLVEGSGGEVILVDAGSGLRAFEPYFRRTPRRDILLLMTHYHLDHVLGLPTFPLLHGAKWSLEIAAPILNDVAVKDSLPHVMANPFWPVPLSTVEASVNFATLSRTDACTRGSIAYRWCRVHHPGQCAAYRFDEADSGASVVIATDIEWDPSTAAEKEDFVRLCSWPRPADVLIFDGQFAPERYERHRGWGHSRWTDGVDAARLAGVGRLLITHHAPDRDDSSLDAVEQELKTQMPEAALLRQGGVVDLPPE